MLQDSTALNSMPYFNQYGSRLYLALINFVVAVDCYILLIIYYIVKLYSLNLIFQKL